MNLESQIAIQSNMIALESISIQTSSTIKLHKKLQQRVFSKAQEQHLINSKLIQLQFLAFACMVICATFVCCYMLG